MVVLLLNKIRFFRFLFLFSISATLLSLFRALIYDVVSSITRLIDCLVCLFFFFLFTYVIQNTFIAGFSHLNMSFLKEFYLSLYIQLQDGARTMAKAFVQKPIAIYISSPLVLVVYYHFNSPLFLFVLVGFLITFLNL